MLDQLPFDLLYHLSFFFLNHNDILQLRLVNQTLFHAFKNQNVDLWQRLGKVHFGWDVQCNSFQKFQKKSCFLNNFEKGKLKQHSLSNPEQCLCFDIFLPGIMLCGSNLGLNLWNFDLIVEKFERSTVFQTRDAVFDVEFQNQTIFGVGFSSGQVSIVDLPTLTTLHQIKKHTEGVTRVCFKDSLLVTTSLDLSIEIFDSKSWNSVFSIPQAHSDWINYCAQSDNYLVSAADDGFLKVWDLRTFGLVTSIKVDGCLTSCSIVGNQILSTIDGDHFGGVQLFSLSDFQLENSLSLPYGVQDAYSDGHRLIYGCDHGYLNIVLLSQPQKNLFSFQSQSSEMITYCQIFDHFFLSSDLNGYILIFDHSK